MKKILLIFTSIAFCFTLSNCNSCNNEEAVSASGVKKADVKIQTGTDGLTAEQRNIRERLIEDNKPGAIKHLYVISAYSGQVLIYSTVKGKVSSGGKRLTPSSITTCTGSDIGCGGQRVDIGGNAHFTTEVLGDDGTYGSSAEYIYWWDVAGIYHQHYIQGGQILHIASKPIAVKSIVINMEMTNATPEVMKEAPTDSQKPKKP